MECSLHSSAVMQMTISSWKDFEAPNSSVSDHILPKNQTIILVEDQSDLRWLLKRRLEINGYTCLEAANGREALALIQQHPSIRLILSDYLMPEMNGLQLLHVLRQDPKNRNIPFILITASWSDQLQHLGMNAGAFAILAKPYHHGELVHLLEQGLST
ncbi:response regulator [Candidatus Nitrospira neomarina]|uniref:Response regulator n=1 Tax=Candidatus Nitrospira neomarina TaxID=3020899 RepID=A0AA96K1B7_9BACT|nr:response regulator [Candidatus Nitrospira neomarina]WNM62941.1 response regulator [Candidatus Nitrospira neomarina]